MTTFGTVCFVLLILYLFAALISFCFGPLFAELLTSIAETPQDKRRSTVQGVLFTTGILWPLALWLLLVHQIEIYKRE